MPFWRLKMFLTDVKNGAHTVVGVKQTRKAITNNKAETVFVAMDADAHVTEALTKACQEKQIPLEKVPTMAELGTTCGIHVGASAAAILKD
jgi:large subunit ribosomal protein L7A